MDPLAFAVEAYVEAGVAPARPAEPIAPTLTTSRLGAGPIRGLHVTMCKYLQFDPRPLSSDLKIAAHLWHDSEINFALSSFWDGGITAQLGDEMNGFLAEGTFATVADAERWLCDQARVHFPDSEFAKSTTH